MGFGLRGQRESCRTARQLDRTERQKDLESCKPVFNFFCVVFGRRCGVMDYLKFLF